MQSSEVSSILRTPGFGAKSRGFCPEAAFCRAAGAGWRIAFGSFSLALRGGTLGAGSAPPSVGQQSSEERQRTQILASPTRDVEAIARFAGGPISVDRS